MVAISRKSRDINSLEDEISLFPTSNFSLLRCSRSWLSWDPAYRALPEGWQVLDGMGLCSLPGLHSVLPLLLTGQCTWSVLSA